MSSFEYDAYFKLQDLNRVPEQYYISMQINFSEKIQKRF